MKRFRSHRLVPVLTAAVLLLAGGPAWAGGSGHGGGSGGGHGGGGWGGGGHGGGWGGGGWAGHGGYGWGGHGGYYGLGGYGWGGWGWGWGGYGWGGLGWGYPGYGYGGYGYGYAPILDPGYYSGPSVYAPTYYYTYPNFIGSNATTHDGLAHVQLKVPADAEVWFNGQQMKQTGTERSFKSPPITPGEKYSYTVKAKWTENGQPVERTKTFLVQADQQVSVDLTQAVSAPVAPVSTASAGQVARLTVLVPTADAEVWLNGQRMNQTGTERHFKSPPITPGQKFSYEVRARWMDNGRPVERTETVAFQAGQQVSVNLSKPVLSVQK